MPELLKGLLIALAASSLTLGAHQVLVPPAVPRVTSIVPITSGRDADVESVLSRLEALLEHQHPQLVGGLSSPAETFTARRIALGPPSVPDEIQEVLERLTAIERKLSVRPALVRELRPLDRLRPPDVAAIRAAIDLRGVDREASEFDLRMRTMHEIVDRFGYPGKAEPCGGDTCDVYWRYEFSSTDPESPNYFVVYFKGGLVMFTESRWTD